MIGEVLMQPSPISPALVAHNWMRAYHQAAARAQEAEQRAAKAEREVRHLRAACAMLHADLEKTRQKNGDQMTAKASDLEAARRDIERLKAENKALRQAYLLSLSIPPGQRATVH